MAKHMQHIAVPKHMQHIARCAPVLGHEIEAEEGLAEDGGQHHVCQEPGAEARVEKRCRSQ